MVVILEEIPLDRSGSGSDYYVGGGSGGFSGYGGGEGGGGYGPSVTSAWD